ncbi:MAG: hypothetical protein HY698_07690 [Deltaproteobacteria bacterium]|nr:hypothetical protein [Deltaproteobacteria bacterium]
MYIEGPVDNSAPGRARLAAAIAGQYRISTEQVARSLEQGRLRVKSDVDEPTALRYSGELTAVGAVVTVINAETGAPLSARPPRVTARGTGPSSNQSPLVSAQPTVAGARPAGSRAPAAPQQEGPAKFESGLRHAQAVPDQSIQLGVLGQADASTSSMPLLQLATLDGGDDSEEPTTVPSMRPLKVEFEEDADPSKQNRGGTVYTPPKDPFRPPDSEEAPLELLAPPTAAGRPSGAKPATLAPAQPLDIAPKARVSTEQAVAQAAAQAAETTKPLAAEVDPTAKPPAPKRSGVLEKRPSVSMPRGGVASRGSALAAFFEDKQGLRLALGLVLALVVGYVPAEIYASHAETSDYGAIRKQLLEEQSGDLTLAHWEELPAIREAATKRMLSARSRIAGFAMITWILAGTGVGYLWFRRLT